MIRTTISLPETVLNQWKAEAFRRDMTLGEIVLSKAGMGRQKSENIGKKIKADFARFDRIAKYAKRYDAVAAVREERDRDNDNVY